MILRELVNKSSCDAIKSALANAHVYTDDDLAEGLIAAVRRDDTAIVKLLLDSGAEPNYLPLRDWSALHSAVEHQQTAMVRFLVDNGCDVNLRDMSGSTPLHVAIDMEGDGAMQLGRTPTAHMTKLLLDLGADPSIRDNAGKSSLDLAKDYGHAEAVAILSSR